MILRNKTACTAYEITLPLSLLSCHPLNLAILITVSAPKVKYVHVTFHCTYNDTCHVMCGCSIDVIAGISPLFSWCWNDSAIQFPLLTSCHSLTTHTDARPPEVRYTLNKIWLQPTATLSGPCAHNSQGVAKSGNTLKSWRHLLKYYHILYPNLASGLFILLFSHIPDICLVIIIWHIPLDAEPVCNSFNRVGRDTAREQPSVQGVGGAWATGCHCNKSIMLIPACEEKS